jgi:putative endonuclease
MAQHNKLGKKGEEVAARYLMHNGYTIIQRNWRYGKDEIDIIAQNKEYLIFIEVKTRSTQFFGDPEEAVNEKKQQFMIRAAEEYVNQNEINQEIRFDIISIILQSGKQTLRHIEDAFYPTMNEE